MKERKYPSRVTLWRDTNEGNPEIFPQHLRWISPAGRPHLLQIDVQDYSLTRQRGLAGDYTFAEFPRVVSVEKKGSLRELRQNLVGSDNRRFRKALDRLVSEYEYPIMLWTFSQSECFQNTKWVHDPEEILDRSIRMVLDSGCRLLWLPLPKTVEGIRRHGEILIRTMWGCVVRHLRAGPSGIQ